MTAKQLLERYRVLENAPAAPPKPKEPATKPGTRPGNPAPTKPGKPNPFKRPDIKPGTEPSPKMSDRMAAMRMRHRRPMAGESRASILVRRVLSE